MYSRATVSPPRPTILGFALLLTGCSYPATQALIWIDVASGSTLGARATALTVTVEDERGGQIFDERRSLSAQRLPASISLVPKDDDPSRSFRATLRLLEEPDTVLAEQVAESSFVLHEQTELRLLFEDACAGVRCGEGRSCLAGRCQRACYPPTQAKTSTRSAPGVCPCRCSCAGDQCEAGACVPRQKVSRVSAGHDHSCALTDQGQVYCWGNNRRGQLGAGELEPQSLPMLVPLDGTVQAIAAGPEFSCAALSDGRVYCFGAGDHGQLGPGATSDQRAPLLLVDDSGRPLSQVKSLGLGGVVGTAEASAHGCAVLENGDLMCWGRNDYGQLGVGQTSASAAPARVMTSLAADGMVEVELGGFHTCARQRIGRLWCWGRDHDWQLGFMDQVDRSLPEVVSDEAEFSGVIDAAAGTWHSCGISADGTLWCWGEDAEWRLGLGTAGRSDGADIMVPTKVLSAQRWKAIDAGHRHSCAIDAAGSLWCFGTSVDGETGVRAAQSTPYSPPVELADGPWESIALGTSYSCGVRSGGALYCWGRNDQGQLGVGNTDNQPVPARVCLP